MPAVAPQIGRDTPHIFQVFFVLTVLIQKLYPPHRYQNQLQTRELYSSLITV